MRTLTPRWGQRRATADAHRDAARAGELARTWREACDYAGLATHVRVPAGETVVVPELRSVTGTDPMTMVVRLLPGMLAGDIAAQSARLANALGGARLTATAMGTEHARLVVHRVDPLADAFDVDALEADGFLGVDEDGTDLAIPWAARVHALFQGSSGFGKSTLLYAQLAPLALRCEVQVAGIDPSGLVFRPWAGLPGDRWRVSGLGGALVEHHRVLEELCAEMDRRLELLPPGVDNLTPTPQVPLLVVVIEESSGFLRALDADRKLAPVLRGLLGRLFSEGRKVGIRALVVIPRADATVLGAGIRDQCQLRVSFAVEPEGFRMAHPVGAGIDPGEHAGAPAGIAVVTAPGVGTRRIRTGRLVYAAYCARVAGAVAGAA